MRSFLVISERLKRGCTGHNCRLYPKVQTFRYLLYPRLFKCCYYRVLQMCSVLTFCKKRNTTVEPHLKTTSSSAMLSQCLQCCRIGYFLFLTTAVPHFEGIMTGTSVVTLNGHIIHMVLANDTQWHDKTWHNMTCFNGTSYLWRYTSSMHSSGSRIE